MRAVAICVLIAVPACGGGEPLTCDLLADPTNCWAVTAQAIASCLPAVGAPPVFNANRSSCSFPEGTQIVFDAPLPNDTIDLERLAFSIVRSDDSLCGRFVDTFMNRIELEAGDHTTVAELHSGGDFHLHCDDASFEAPFDDLFTCTAPSVPPTDGFEVTPTSVSVTIVSVLTPGELFRCIQ